MRCIIGLGNPGEHYSATRHNVGRMVVERFGKTQQITFRQGPHALHGSGAINAHRIQLVLPQTWMNQTGVVIDELLRCDEISVRDLIVVYDDLDLHFGTLRIKTRGGAGGHNGIRSILAASQSDQFCRLKIGIGHPGPGFDVAEYVLSPFSSSEVDSLDGVLSRAVDALEVMVLNGPEAAMNQFNVQQMPES
ncbi:MAG: peptidyl-tRNA hydrolase [Nitrospirales bacterium]|nr:MAG: peptidyl-tRNA hydrolase [Nitrospirales bacterium]